VSEAGWLRKSMLLTRKDLRVEARGRDTLAPMLAFALAVTLLLAFTLPGGTALSAPLEVLGGTVAVADMVSGFLWVTVLFAGLIGFARTFEVEREDSAIDSLLLVPLDRSFLFLAKAAANLAYIAAVEVVLLPVFALFFSIQLGSRWLLVVLVTVLVDLGFVAIGTLFAALAAQTRSRELILPILALPALVPLFIAAVELSSDLFAGGDLDQIAARGWFAVLVAFDVVFVTIGALAFEFAID
jgi:heme exporter protein B